MTTTTNIKDRCRLCFIRLKDSTFSSAQQKFASTQRHRRIVNIFKARPYSYYDLIGRYLCIHLSEQDSLDRYSPVICGTCADALDKLHSAYQTVEETEKDLRQKYRKTSTIIQYQLNQTSMKTSSVQRTTNNSIDEKFIQPKRQSKRKGAPKHIDQTSNSNKHPHRPVQFLVRIRSPSNDEQRDQDEPEEILTETTNHKKRFKHAITKDSSSSSITESSHCVNLLQNNNTSTERTRSGNSVKGNHIERIAVSLLSGTENQSDLTNDVGSRKKRSRRKVAFEATSTNNILSSTGNNVATILSPSLIDGDDEILSNADVSNDSSSNNHLTGKSRSNGSKVSPSSISSTPTAEGLTITAINQTGQKQVFMAKQLGNLKKYQCGLCEKIVTNIQIHVRRHTNDKPYPCTYCEKRFTNSGDLQIHVRIHTGEKPYACPLCLKSYRTIGNFNSHVKTHDSGTRPHRCELCHQTFPIPKDWYSHLRSSHRSRIPPTNTANSSSVLKSTNTTTTVTQPLFSNAVSNQQQDNEIFLPNKMKLEPINRSQLIIQSSTVDDDEPVNMTKKENSYESDEEDDDDETTEENHHRSTHNLLNNVSSSIVHV